jgi:hypothetical protein
MKVTRGNAHEKHNRFIRLELRVRGLYLLGFIGEDQGSYYNVFNVLNQLPQL